MENLHRLLPSSGRRFLSPGAAVAASRRQVRTQLARLAFLASEHVQRERQRPRRRLSSIPVFLGIQPASCRLPESNPAESISFLARSSLTIQPASIRPTTNSRPAKYVFFQPACRSDTRLERHDGPGGCPAIAGLPMVLVPIASRAWLLTGCRGMSDASEVVRSVAAVIRDDCGRARPAFPASNSVRG